MTADERREDDFYEEEPEPIAVTGRQKLHTTVSHGRKKAENGGWVSLGWSSVGSDLKRPKK